MPYKSGSWGLEAKERGKRRAREGAFVNNNLKNKEKTSKIRQQILDKYGNKCVKCGFSDWRALQIDHINGGGSKEVRFLGQNKYFKSVLADTTGKYQLLCANCNWIKRFENKEMIRAKESDT